jgi:hypothetical protein
MNCSSDKKNEITEKIEKKILEIIELNYESELELRDKNYEKIEKITKTFKHMELILLAMKNNMPINLSRHNYAQLLYDIYVVKKIRNEIFEESNIHKITILENSIYEITYYDFEKYMYEIENNITYIKDKINEIKDEKDIKLLYYKNVVFEDFKYHDRKYQISFLIKYYNKELMKNTNSFINKLLKEANYSEKYKIIDEFEMNIYQKYDSKLLYEIIYENTVIKKNDIKEYLKKHINNLSYLDLIILYNYYINTTQIFYLENVEYINILRNDLIEYYLTIIYNKLKKCYEREYIINENIEILESNIVSAFFVNFYLYSNDYEISMIIPYILKKILYFNTNVFNEKALILLGYKNKICNFDIFYNEYNYIDTIINYYSLYIDNILSYFINLNDLDNINILFFTKNVRDFIYFYYSLACIKIKNFNIENLIDKLYENEIIKKSITEKIILKNSIDKLIHFLLNNKYKFTRESVYFNKIMKNYIEEDELIKNKNDEDMSCPICFEKLNLENTIINDCKHKICKNCFNYMYSKLNPYVTLQCCLCRRNINEIYLTKLMN